MTVVDCYFGQIQGWSIADLICTELAAAALTKAVATMRVDP